MSAGAGIDFKCKKDIGAFLILETPAVTEHIQAKETIVDYMKMRFDSWMSLANDQNGLRLKEEDIYFISGTTKTASWFLSAFQHSMYSGTSVHVSCDLANIASASISSCCSAVAYRDLSTRVR